MKSRTGCIKHGAMGNVQSMSNIRGTASNNGRRRSDGADMVQRDSGILQAPVNTMQCVGCDDTQHSVEFPDARSEVMFANQETNEGHLAEEDDDTRGSLIAEEDAAANDSSDSQMTAKVRG